MRVDELQTALLDYNRGEVFFEHLSDDVVLELPYGLTIGIPARTVGKDSVRERFLAIQATGLTISNLTIEPMREDRFSVEYVGTYSMAGAENELPIVAIVDTRGPLVSRIREYWDSHLLKRLQREASQVG